MPEPSLPSSSFFLSNSVTFFFFLGLFLVYNGVGLGVPQAAVPGGNIDVAVT